MKNFIYESPAKIIFGKNQISALKNELEVNSVKSVLLVYGKASIKRIGLYDSIVSILQELRITYIEESDIRPNPEVSSVRSGIAKCIKHNVDFIIAAGGGSVIDTAKAIAFGRYLDCDVWDAYINKVKATKALPIGAVITLAATGTETNGNTVLSNDTTGEKRSVAYPFLIPQFAIIDPSYTLTVNHHHTIAGSIDIIMHVFEQYFSNTEHTLTSDLMSIGVIQSVIENTKLILDGKDSYDVRANISWASTIGLNWILGVDKVGDWATHRLSYAITKEFGTTHGYALSMLFTSWARVALKYNPETMIRRLSLLGERLFNNIPYQDVLHQIDKLFLSWGAPIRLHQELSIDDTLVNELVQNALGLGSVGTIITVDNDKALEIFNLSLKGE